MRREKKRNGKEKRKKEKKIRRKFVILSYVDVSATSMWHTEKIHDSIFYYYIDGISLKDIIGII